MLSRKCLVENQNKESREEAWGAAHWRGDRETPALEREVCSVGMVDG